MNKTTEALKLAEEALEKVKKLFRSMTADECPDDPYISVGEALAAIREALAEQSIVINDPHPPHRLCECTACLEYWTPLPDCDAFAASGKVIAEPVKQEPIGYVVEDNESYTGSMIYANKSGDEMFPVYLAPVSAKRERVDLTDGELKAALEVHQVGLSVRIGRIAIAAFKEKNK